MTGTYHTGLVLLSLFIATLASYVALELATRVTHSAGLEARLWLVGGAFSMGIGIWSMHFIGMLAFKLPIALAYDIATTLLSLLIAIGISGFALKIASDAALGWKRLLGAGALMGIGISAMHYTGMAALTVVPGIVYDPLLFSVSIAIAIAAASAALWIAYQLRRIKRARLLRWQIGSAFVMGLAITGMHYTGMYAAHFAVGTVCVSGQNFDTFLMSVLVAGFSGLILGITLLIAFLDTRMRQRTASLEQDKSHLETLAMKDPLTLLPNRRLLEERIRSEISTGGNQFAVLFIDLDRFKMVNDSLGHSIGDHLLRTVASRLLECTRSTDTVARIGGDEFVVMLKADNELEDVIEVVGRIQQDLVAPFQIEGHEISVTPSIGIAVYPADGKDPHTLIVSADTAMYQVKKQGRNHYQFFKSEMDSQSHEYFKLENALRAALKNNEMELHYQAIFDLASERIIGVEALTRWRHDGRYISPVEFIPLAEDLGLIAQLGAWVMEEACMQGRRWQAAGIPPLTIAVNISPHQLGREDFEQTVTNILQRTGMDGKYLELEITEGTLLHNIEAISRKLFRLHEHGIRVAIDDFGTGYSNLQYLRRLPIDKLKIDRSFVDDIDNDADDESLVRAVILIGHSLRLAVVAEGVETAEQLDRLRKLSCDQFQGYYRAKPMPAQDFENLIVARAHTREPQFSPLKPAIS